MTWFLYATSPCRNILCFYPSKQIPISEHTCLFAFALAVCAALNSLPSTSSQPSKEFLVILMFYITYVICESNGLTGKVLFYFYKVIKVFDCDVFMKYKMLLSVRNFQLYCNILLKFLYIYPLCFQFFT